MSNIKETIKAEIERLKKILEESTYYLDNSQQALGYSFALDDFKEFLDSLPDEEPSKELEEAAKEYEFSCYQRACFHPEHKWPSTTKDAFIAGAEWQNKQMTKDAVEGEIGYWNQRGLSIRLDKSLEKLGYGEDTEVRIIIVKQ